jgi:hypothetical protein
MALWLQQPTVFRGEVNPPSRSFARPITGRTTTTRG